jgi:tetratricopeptide (TPR) repeat protein
MFLRLVLLGLLVSTAVRAEDLVAARAHYMKAAAAFAGGRYDEAASEFTAAHAAKPDPSLYYNIAQSHRLAGHRAEALANYRRYLEALPDAENRAECEAQIVALTPPPVEKLPEKLPETPVEKLPPIAPASPPTAGTAAHDQARTFKIAGSVLMAGAVVCLAVGGGFGVLAQSFGDELTNDSKNGRSWDPSKASAGEGYQAAEATLLTIGSAALVSGVVHLALGLPDKESKVTARAGGLEVRF